MKEQKPIGYLFNGRFYKTIDELIGRTMSEDNQPQPLFTESQTQAKVQQALQQEREKWKEEVKWVSVKDELPKLTEENDYGRFSKPVLCLNSDGHIEDCQLNEGIDEDDEPYWSYSQDGELCETVTHWMVIPTLPKSNQE